MSNDLLNMINAVIEDIDSLSDTEIQALYEESRNGLVGSALMTCRDFLEFYTYTRVEYSAKIEFGKWLDIPASFDFFDAANDETYQFLMAA